MTNRQLETLFGMISRRFDLSKSEVSFELHPSLAKQVDAADRISTLLRAGVNRFVLGVQSLDPSILRILNRGHHVDEVVQLVKLLNEMGVEICRLTSCMGCRSKRSGAGTTHLSAYWIWE